MSISDGSTLQEAVLNFKSAQLEDSGTYFCTAENIRGNSTRNISLAVNGKTEFTSFIEIVHVSLTINFKQIYVIHIKSYITLQ